MIRLRIAYVIRAIAEALELEDEASSPQPPSGARRPEALSEPFDVIGLWRETSADYAAGVDDDDYWRQGPYL